MPDQTTFFSHLGRILASQSGQSVQKRMFPELAQFGIFDEFSLDDLATWTMVRLLFFLDTVRWQPGVTGEMFEACMAGVLETLKQENMYETYLEKIRDINEAIEPVNDDSPPRHVNLLWHYLLFFVWDVNLPNDELAQLMRSGDAAAINDALAQRGIDEQLPTNAAAEAHFCDTIRGYAEQIEAKVREGLAA
ncbi:hypothetical protein RAS1_38940 [Phycisphaerae bacterium RAS1]|nr:hypothetical protein RAS1_38940 [Phycisphaerae bacterium RAS1]